MLSLLLAVSAATADTLPITLQGAAQPVIPVTPVASVTSAKSEATRSRRFSADSMVLDKSDRKLTLFHRGQVVRTYSVALGTNPVGDKKRRGDGRTPEGLYYINGRNEQSKYHLSLRISYPHVDQRISAERRGVSPGGDIMIHGLPRDFATVGALHRQQDWTEGCVAVTNDEIEEIWRAVPNGARILITP